MSPGDIHGSLDEVSRGLLIREPYFGHLLVSTVRTISAAAAAAQLRPIAHIVHIEVGAQAFSALSAEARKATLKHELLHLALKHPLRARSFARPDLYGLACDLVVHQYMDTSALASPITLDAFPGLPRGASADRYYELLLPIYERCSQGPGEGGAGQEDALRRQLAAAAGDRSHDSWRDFASLSSPALSVLETHIDALLQATVARSRSRGWGRLPSGLQELLDRLVENRSEVPWRRVLRLFGASSERTYLKDTLTRPSKRYGTCPGVRVKRRTHLVVAVDTSGSVPAGDMALFFSEIHALWRRGAAVTVLESDAAVTSAYPYRGTPPGAVQGRGGTDFNPAIIRANELSPDGVIYFTDGGAPAPTTRCRAPLLWVLSKEGCDLEAAAHLPGRKIRLTDPQRSER